MTKNKIQVDIDEILDMKAKLQYVNTKELDQIIWMRNGSAIEFRQADAEEWEFTGLSNTDFVEFYLDTVRGEHMDD